MACICHFSRLFWPWPVAQTECSGDIHVFPCPHCNKCKCGKAIKTEVTESDGQVIWLQGKSGLWLNPPVMTPEEARLKERSDPNAVTHTQVVDYINDCGLLAKLYAS